MFATHTDKHMEQLRWLQYNSLKLVQFYQPRAEVAGRISEDEKRRKDDTQEAASSQLSDAIHRNSGAGS